MMLFAALKRYCVRPRLFCSFYIEMRRNFNRSDAKMLSDKQQ